MTNEELMARFEKTVKEFNVIVSGVNLQGGFSELKPQATLKERVAHLEKLHDNFTIRGSKGTTAEGSFKTGFAINHKCPELAAETGGHIPTGGGGGGPPPPECLPVSIKLSYNAGTSLLDCKTDGGCAGNLCWLAGGSGYDHSVCWDITECSLDDTVTLPDTLKCFTGGDPEFISTDVELIYIGTGSNISLEWIITAQTNSCCAFTHTVGPSIYTLIDQSVTINTGFTPAVNMQVDISFSGSLC